MIEIGKKVSNNTHTKPYTEAINNETLAKFTALLFFEFKNL